MSKQVSGANKSVDNGRVVPVWMTLIHSLDDLQGQHRLNRYTAMTMVKGGVSIDVAFNTMLSGATISRYKDVGP